MSTAQTRNNEETYKVPRFLSSIYICEEFSKIIPLHRFCFLESF